MQNRPEQGGVGGGPFPVDAGGVAAVVETQQQAALLLLQVQQVGLLALHQVLGLRLSDPRVDVAAPIRQTYRELQQPPC